MGTSRATRGRGRVFGALVAVALVAAACGSAASTRRATRPPCAAVVDHARVADRVAVRARAPPAPSNEIGVDPGRDHGRRRRRRHAARVPVFRSNWEAMQAFAAYCNAQGGIAGRRLDVRLFDTNVFHHRQAITDSCTSVFALVGSAAAFDGDGASVETDCGIPDVPALVAEPAHERVPTVVAPLPNPQQLYLVGPLRYLARIAPAAVRQRGDGLPRRRRHRGPRRPPGRGEPGPSATGSRSIDTIPALTGAGRLRPDRRPHRAPGRRSTSRCRARSPTSPACRRRSPRADYRPKIVDARAALLRPALPARRRAPRPRAPTCSRRRRRSTTPARVPELGRYVDWLQRTVPGAEPTAQGVRSWSAGLLFAEAARRASAHLDRTTLLARLRAVHAWDGNGIQIPTDPGAGARVHVLRLRPRRRRRVPARVSRPGLRLPARRLAPPPSRLHPSVGDSIAALAQAPDEARADRRHPDDRRARDRGPRLPLPSARPRRDQQRARAARAGDRRCPPTSSALQDEGSLSAWWVASGDPAVKARLAGRAASRPTAPPARLPGRGRRRRRARRARGGQPHPGAATRA